MSEDIKSVIQNGLNDVSAQFNAKFKQLESEVTDLARKGFGHSPDSFRAGKGESVGEQFIQFKGLQELRSGSQRSGFMEVKNTITNLLAGTFSGQVNDRIGEDKRPALNLLQALPSMVISTPSVDFQRLDGYSNAADTQALEGDPKAQGAVHIEIVTAPVETIAHYFKASEQLLADSPLVAKQIDNLLRYGVLQKAESRLLHGSGAVGQMLGLMTAATAATPSAALSAVDRIGEQAAAMDAAGWAPSHVVLNRADFFKIISERDTEGRYVTTTPYDAERNTVWGLSIVISAGQTLGQALVFDAAQVMMLDRESVRVEAGRVNDDFVSNVISIRGEARLGLAIFSPSAFAKFALV